MWDPRQYEAFADERGRPFGELLARVTARSPSFVVDLGCGTGALTAALLDRWPDARVVGVDSSAEMLARAQQHARPPQLSFESGDIGTWRTETPVDVLVSNAALQWVPDHLELLPTLVESLTPGGWLAFQVPGNFDAPSHTLLRDLARQPQWRGLRDRVANRYPNSSEPASYLDVLAGLGCRVDAWETTYLHVLQGADPVLEWVRGTALRPVLAALDPDEAARFTAEYGALLRDAYPATPYGTVLPFRRIFVAARRPGPEPA